MLLLQVSDADTAKWPDLTAAELSLPYTAVKGSKKEHLKHLKRALLKGNEIEARHLLSVVLASQTKAWVVEAQRGLFSEFDLGRIDKHLRIDWLDDHQVQLETWLAGRIGGWASSAWVPPTGHPTDLDRALKLLNWPQECPDAWKPLVKAYWAERDWSGIAAQVLKSVRQSLRGAV